MIIQIFNQASMDWIQGQRTIPVFSKLLFLTNIKGIQIEDKSENMIENIEIKGIDSHLKLLLVIENWILVD